MSEPRPRAGGSRTFKTASALYLTLYAVIYGGWLTHSSGNPDVLNYSWKYIAFLSVMAIPFVFPFALRFYIRRLGTQGALMSLIPLLLVGMLTYVGGGYWYYYTREHPFDPFLQARPPTPPESAEPDAIRILTLGGSTTRNAHLPPHQRYPTVLQSVLSEWNPDRRISVFNAGMEWYTTRHSATTLLLLYRDWQPDFVVLMHAINDLCRSFNPPQYSLGDYHPHWTHYYGPSTRGAAPEPYEVFLIRRILGPAVDAWYGKLRIRPRALEPADYRSLPQFEKNLNTVVDLVQGSRATMVLATQPSIYRGEMTREEQASLWMSRETCSSDAGFAQRTYPTSESQRNAMHAFNEVVRHVARERAVLIVEGARAVPADLSHFTDDVHFTSRGADRLAREVAAVLQPHLEELAERTDTASAAPRNRGR